MNHNKHNNLSIVDSLVSITSHTEKTNLEKSLLLALNDVMPTQSIRLFRAHESDLQQISFISLSADEVTFATPEDIASQPISSKLSSTIDDVSRHGEYKSVAGAGDMAWQVIYPSFDTRNTPFLILVQSCQQPTEWEQKAVHGIFKVYANHVALIEKTQRDKLTSLFNRETLDDEITKILVSRESELFEEDITKTRRSRSGQARNWLGIMDIDHFKQINDTYGHLYGDEVLILTSRIMTSGCMRDDDLVYRYGGEEFVVLLKAASQEDAFNAFERLRIIIAEHDFPQVGNVTISIGFVEVTSQQAPSDVIGEAMVHYITQNIMVETKLKVIISWLKKAC